MIADCKDGNHQHTWVVTEPKRGDYHLPDKAAFFSRLNAPDRLQSQIKSGERGGRRTLWEKYGDGSTKGKGEGKGIPGG